MKILSMQKKIQRIYKWMEGRLPLGIPAATELNAFVAAFIASTIYSIGNFTIHFDYCLGALYADSERTILLPANDPYVDMMPFGEIAESTYAGFLFIGFALVLLTYYHYRYHFQKSKSIYLMRRLPAKNELQKRCLTLPLLGLTIIAVTALVLTGIYYWIYITLTPASFL